MDGTADNLEAPPGEPLTRREQEILVFLDEGFTAPEIAEQLSVLDGGRVRARGLRGRR